MTAAPTFKSDFLQTLQARGYVHQISHPEELDNAAVTGVVPAYIGFDATASSLHVGNLVSVMLLRRLQQAGGKPIVLMGGGTTKVGDPSGKDATRQLLTAEQIDENIDSIKQVFSKFLIFGDGPTDAIMVNNDEWLSRFGYIQFLRDYGVHFTVNRMLTFDSVKTRLEREQPLTFIEFNYMLMQSVDFLELSRRYGCALQMGGSDQWGNIVSGADLIRRVDQRPAFALTSPLITTSSGAKMGKTAAGAVWLNADRLSPYDYWQFWRNTEDADRAAEAARQAFEEGAVSGDLPSFTLNWAGPEGRFSQRTASSLVHACGLASSMSEARRLIQQGAVRIDDERITTDKVYDRAHQFKVQVGKTKIALLNPI